MESKHDRRIVRFIDWTQWFKTSEEILQDLAETHYNDVIMSEMVSQLTSLTSVYLTLYSGTDQRKHQSSASLAFVRGIYRWPVNSPRKGPITRKMFSFDDVLMSRDNCIMENPLKIIMNYPCAIISDYKTCIKLWFIVYSIQLSY